MTAPRSRQARDRRRPLLLEGMERRELLTVYNVTNNGDSGGGTLRDAITQANTNPGPDQIFFGLPADQLRIVPLSPLPAVTDPGTVIDGTSQTGYNRLAPKPLVILDGSSAGTNSVALSITGGNSTVAALVIQNWAGAGGVGIAISGGGRDVIRGNYIGTSATGNQLAANGGDGIDINSSNNTIGGTNPGQGNVISGNVRGILVNGFSTTGNVILGNIIGLGADGTTLLGNSADGIITNAASGTQIGGSVQGARNVISGNNGGIVVQSVGVTSTTIQGNYIGTDITGTIAKPNTFDGITINSGANNQIGGVGAAGNVISGNGGRGILLFGASTKNNLVKGNKIGVAANGTSPLGNGQEGIDVQGANNAVIGGVSAAEGNIIAYNGATFKTGGVYVQSGSGIEILSNSIFSNIGNSTGIGQGNPGGIVISRGANNNQAAPVITQAQTGAGQVNAQGRLNATPNTDYTIQFFSNPTADISGFGQGQDYLGSIIVTTDPTGLATFDARVSGTVAVGQFLTATATESGTQNTSAFSADILLARAPVTDLALTLTTNPTSGLLLGAPEVYTLTVTNNGPDPATGVTVVSSLDPNSNYVSDTTTVGTSSQNGGVVTTTIGNLAAGQSATITITVTAAASGTITLDSVLSGNEIDADNSNNSVSASIDVLPAADLAVTITPDPNPVAVNGALTYVVTVTNNGPSPANNVTLNDTLDPSETIVSADSPDGIVTINGNVYTLNIDTLPVNATATLTLVVTPTQIGDVSNTAVAQATEGDAVTGNNTATSTVSVQMAADLILGVTTQNPATIGQPFTYTFTVTNNGPFDATGVVFTDTLPTNATFVSASVNGVVASGVQSNSTLVLDLPTIPANSSVTVEVTLVASASVVVNNSATVSNTVELDQNPANNRAVSPPVFVSPADIDVTLTQSANPATLNTPFTYTLTVKNNGPATATNIVATQTLDGNLILGQTTDSGNATVSVSSGLLTATIASLDPGQSEVITLRVTPTVSGPITSTATVDPSTASNIDPNPLNNTSIASTVVSPADLVVAVTPSNRSPIVGTPFSFTITVANNGPATADNVVITGALPGNVVFTGETAGPGVTVNVANGLYRAVLSSLAPHAFSRITFTLLPTATGTATLTADVNSNEFDPDNSNNSATGTASVINLPGTFQFSAPFYTVNENGGAINILVTRTDGTLGAVAVGYATSDGTARAGVNYLPADGVLNFANGQSSAVITVRVLDDTVITRQVLNFNVSLTAISGGGVLNPTARTATVGIINTDVDLIPPTVTSVTPITDGRTVTAVVISFSESLDPLPAGFVPNYQITTATGAQVPILRAVYNDSNHTVTLITARPLSAGQFYTLAINGTVATPVTDVYGNALDGDGNGTAGGNFFSSFGIGATKLVYTDASGNTVTLKLSGGGLMNLTRLANGNGNVLQLSGIVKHKSKLTGTVKKTKGRGNGITTLNTIQGFGNFADVLSHLATPPFFVASEVPSSGTTTATLSSVHAALVSAVVPHGPVKSHKR